MPHTIEGVKGEGGRWYVRLPAETARTAATVGGESELVHVLKSQVEDLQLRLDTAETERSELRVLLLRQNEQLTRLLPAPRDEQRSAERDEPQERPDDVTEPKRRPVWRRWPWQRRV